MFTDLKELEMDGDIKQIKSMKKLELKSILDKKIKEKVFEDLNKQKKNHSKVCHIKHTAL